MNDIEFAKQFAVAYNLLPTEHWGQPVHRLQLQLMQTAVKRALLDGYFPFSDSQEPHPHDSMYLVDSDFDYAFQDWSGIQLSDQMTAIAVAQRKIFHYARQHDIAHILREEPNHFPDPLKPLTWQSKKYGLVPSMIGIENVKATGTTVMLGTAGVRFGLPSLKPRSIDPLVSHLREGTRPYSQDNPDFRSFIGEQANRMNQAYVATHYMNPEAARWLCNLVLETNTRWQQTLQDPSKARKRKDLQEAVEWGARRAAGMRFDIITDR